MFYTFWPCFVSIYECPNLLVKQPNFYLVQISQNYSHSHSVILALIFSDSQYFVDRSYLVWVYGGSEFPPESTFPSPSLPTPIAFTYTVNIPPLPLLPPLHLPYSPLPSLLCLNIHWASARGVPCSRLPSKIALWLTTPYSDYCPVPNKIFNVPWILLFFCFPAPCPLDF